jgi:hypothetical protein
MKQIQEDIHSFFFISTRRRTAFGCNLQPRNTKNVSIFYLENDKQENILGDFIRLSSPTSRDKKSMDLLVKDYNHQNKGIRIRDCYQFNRSESSIKTVSDVGFSNVGSFYCRDVLYYKHFIRDNVRSMGSLSILFSLQNTKDEYRFTPTNTTTVMRATQSYFPHVILPICITPGFPYLDQLVEWKEQLMNPKYHVEDSNHFKSPRDPSIQYTTKGGYIRAEIQSQLNIKERSIIESFFRILGVSDQANPNSPLTEDEIPLHQFLQEINSQEKYNHWKDLSKNVFVYIVHRKLDEQGKELPIDQCPYFFYEYSKESIFLWLNRKNHSDSYHVCSLVCRVNKKSVDRRPGSLFDWTIYDEKKEKYDKQETKKSPFQVKIRKESDLNPTDGDNSITKGTVYCSTTVGLDKDKDLSRPDLYRLVDPWLGVIHANLSLVEPGVVENNLHYRRMWRYFQQIDLDREIPKLNKRIKEILPEMQNLSDDSLREYSLYKGFPWIEQIKNLCENIDADIDVKGKLFKEVLPAMNPNPNLKQVKFSVQPLSERAILTQGDVRGGTNAAYLYIQRNTSAQLPGLPSTSVIPYYSGDESYIFPLFGHIYHPRTRTLRYYQSNYQSQSSITRILQNHHTKSPLLFKRYVIQSGDIQPDDIHPEVINTQVINPEEITDTKSRLFGVGIVRELRALYGDHETLRNLFDLPVPMELN